MKRRDFILASAALAAAPEVLARTAGVTLVLGGGGCRGYGHFGVLRVLDKHGLRPDLVVGLSAGCTRPACPWTRSSATASA